MSDADRMRTIKKVRASTPARLHLTWSDGHLSQIDLSDWMTRPAFTALADPQTFLHVAVGDWGHSLEWPGGVEISADSLWMEALSASKHEDARQFMEWRLKHGLSLSGAAEALGLSRRMVAYYSNAEKPVPRTVLLACRGWEVDRGRRRPGTRNASEQR